MLQALALFVALSMPDSVFVSRSGTHFHLASDADSTYVMVLRSDAEQAGFLPCGRCFNPKPKKSKPFDRLKHKPK